MSEHLAVIIQRIAGDWGVICHECSEAAFDYVYPCMVGRWRDPIPPPVLTGPCGHREQATA